MMVAVAGAAACLLFKGFALGRWPVVLGLLALSSIPFWEVYRLLQLMREQGEEASLLDVCTFKWPWWLFAVLCWIMIALLFRGRIANFLRPATVPDEQRSRATVGVLAFAALIGISVFKYWGLPALLNWPVDTEDAVVTLIESLSEEDRRKLAGLDDEELLDLYLGLGISVRDQFGLWNDGNSRLLESVCGDEPCHPDDASGIILERARERLQAQYADVGS
ncbi:MAG TPA: hypothetical protein PKY22_09865 [Accumulibacter sp.]|nr:hypothetical protein [Accumulibacter sp.]